MHVWQKLPNLPLGCFSVSYRLKPEWKRSQLTALRRLLKLFNCCIRFTAVCISQGSPHQLAALIKCWNHSSRGPLLRRHKKSSTVCSWSFVSTRTSTGGCWMTCQLGEWRLCLTPVQGCFLMGIPSISGYNRWRQFAKGYIYYTLVSGRMK